MSLARPKSLILTTLFSASRTFLAARSPCSTWVGREVVNRQRAGQLKGGVWVKSEHIAGKVLKGWWWEGSVKVEKVVRKMERVSRQWEG